MSLPKTKIKCTICKKKLPNTEEYFYFRKNGSGERSRNWCRECTKEQHFIKTYGITKEKRNEMYISQDGCCRICDNSFSLSKLCIDHDHNTGKVRGLLCVFCNTLVGYLEKRPTNVNKALDYIKHYHE